MVVPDNQGPLCRLSHRDPVAESAGYCRNHALRWRNRERPAADVFEAEVLNLGDSRHDFSLLPEQLKVEVT